MGSSLAIGTTNWVLVGRSTLAADGKALSVSGIPSGYAMLFMISELTLAAGTEVPQMKFNDDGGLHYWESNAEFQPPNAVIFATALTTSSRMPEAHALGASIGTTYVTQRYSSTTTKGYQTTGGNPDKSLIVAGSWASANEVSKITITTAANDMLAGSTMAVYGVI